MITLSAFADEISADLREQVAVLQSEHIHHIDLRSAWGANVLDLSDEQVQEIKRTLAGEGMAVAAIGSPIGKVPLDAPFDEHFRRFERAIEVAQVLGTRYIRIFSFYPPTSGGSVDPASYRDEVIERLRKMTASARVAGLVLLHENEQRIYGDTIAHCVDLLESVNDPHLRAAFDPANFLQCHQVPYPDGYEQLHPWLEYMHVKDVKADGTLVVAGEGDARWSDTLQHLHVDGYDGFMALEPHLAVAGQLQGFSGPELFRKASQTLQGLLQEIGWEYK